MHKNPLIKDWLGDFLDGHAERHPRDDWPRDDTHESRRQWSLWLRELIEYRVTRPEAEAASAEMNGDAIEALDDHLWVLVRAVHAIRERPKAGPPPPVAPVESMTDAERSAAAAAMLDEWYAAGWSFDWWDGALHPRRAVAGIPTMGREWCARFRLLRVEVYALMGHPLPDEEVLDMAGFRGSDGKFSWRAMVAALSAKTVVEGADVGHPVQF